MTRYRTGQEFENDDNQRGMIIAVNERPSGVLYEVRWITGEPEFTDETADYLNQCTQVVHIPCDKNPDTCPGYFEPGNQCDYHA